MTSPSRKRQEFPDSNESDSSEIILRSQTKPKRAYKLPPRPNSLSDIDSNESERREEEFEEVDMISLHRLCKEAVGKPSMHKLVAEKLRSEESWGLTELDDLLLSISKACYTPETVDLLYILLQHRHFRFSFEHSQIFAFVVCECVILYRMSRIFFQGYHSIIRLAAFLKSFRFTTAKESHLEFLQHFPIEIISDPKIYVFVSKKGQTINWIPTLVRLAQNAVLCIAIPVNYEGKEALELKNELLGPKNGYVCLLSESDSIRFLASMTAVSLDEEKDLRPIRFWWGQNALFSFHPEMFVSNAFRLTQQKRKIQFETLFRLIEETEESDSSEGWETTHFGRFLDQPRIRYSRQQISESLDSILHFKSMEEARDLRLRKLFYFSLRETALTLHRVVQHLFENKDRSIPDLVIERILFLADHPVFRLSESTVNIAAALLHVRKMI